MNIQEFKVSSWEEPRIPGQYLAVVKDTDDNINHRYYKIVGWANRWMVAPTEKVVMWYELPEL